MDPSALLNVPVELMQRAVRDQSPHPAGERGQRQFGVIVALLAMLGAVVAGWFA